MFPKINFSCIFARVFVDKMVSYQLWHQMRFISFLIIPPILWNLFQAVAPLFPMCDRYSLDKFCIRATRHKDSLNIPSYLNWI